MVADDAAKHESNLSIICSICKDLNDFCSEWSTPSVVRNLSSYGKNLSCKPNTPTLFATQEFGATVALYLVERGEFAREDVVNSALACDILYLTT